MKNESDVERVAQILHRQWVEWARDLYPEVYPERRGRWDSYFVPYRILDEEVKDIDRKLAKEILLHVNLDNPTSIFWNMVEIAEYLLEFYPKELFTYPGGENDRQAFVLALSNAVKKIHELEDR